MSAAFTAHAVNFTGVLNWKKSFSQILRRGLPFPSHMRPHKLPLLSCLSVMELTAQQPRRAGPLNGLHGTQGQKNRGSALGAVFLCPFRGTSDDCCTKGCFCDHRKLTLLCCWRNQQCRAPLTCTLWNPVILGVCFLLVLGKGSEHAPNRRQMALVGHGWAKGPLAPAQLQIHLSYITKGEL